MIKILNSTILIGAIALASCKKDTTPEPIPPAPDECPDEISFAATIQPYFTNNCAGCHGTGGQAPELSNHATISTSAEAASSRMNLDESDALFMPMGGTKDAAFLEKLKCWINQGKLDN